VFVHGLLAGSDTPALLGMYVGSGLLVLGSALSRYVARRPAILDEPPLPEGAAR
jgi:hypothetical protein